MKGFTVCSSTDLLPKRILGAQNSHLSSHRHIDQIVAGTAVCAFVKARDRSHHAANLPCQQRCDKARESPQKGC